MRETGYLGRIVDIQQRSVTAEHGSNGGDGHLCILVEGCYVTWEGRNHYN